MQLTSMSRIGYGYAALDRNQCFQHDNFTSIHFGREAILVGRAWTVITSEYENGHITPFMWPCSLLPTHSSKSSGMLHI
jgi:hypothetical protein